MDETVKTGADIASRVARKTIDNMGDGAQRIQEGLVHQGKRSAEMVRHQVEERPVTSLLVAFGIGLVLGRFCMR